MALPSGGVSLCEFSPEDDQVAVDKLSSRTFHLSSIAREPRCEKEEWARKENGWAQERLELPRKLETLEDTQAWVSKQAEQSAKKAEQADTRLREERAKKRQAREAHSKLARELEALKKKMAAEVNGHRETRIELRRERNSRQETYAALESHLRGCPSEQIAEEVVEQRRERERANSVYSVHYSSSIDDFEMIDPLDDYIPEDVVVR
ncbi:hypothetical protein E8E13_004516 [Curvularia kusanoi]|uniref:Uncharacterized protein n=1 Tax=Curvularia kusanoi TaxID=90978 RepID=A0A9P4W819_CURKU|nr:hypothetical protein E8E13_004516 [Curvularia kusanoi]